MESFIIFFENITIGQKLGWVLSCLIFAWLLEAGIPLIRHQYKKWRHDGINLVFFSFTMMINFVVGISTVGVFLWIENEQFGILNWLELPVWIELTIAVLILDFFAQYVIHYILHRVKWMWKMHMVHHSDTKVDATTGTRHHPGDYLTRELFGLIVVISFGIPVGFWAFYRICTIFFTYWTHANISLPDWFDRGLSLIFITPNLHKFHHHFERPWTDSNFGNIFSFWDRMFGTFVYEDPNKIQFGVDTADGSRDEDIGYQLGLPLNKNIKTDY
jgi:sterol desaturase/sphingolipid hydroxylase (fatty acid hydroxylase superfamily)